MQHRRKFLIQGSLALGAAALMKPFQGFSMEHSFTGNKDSQIITILHTSDLHITDALRNDAFGDNLTSIERSLTAIKKNSPNTVLLHNGNFTESTTAYSEKHLDKLKALEVMGYDAVVLGQQDICQCDDFFNHLSNRDSLCIIDSIWNENRLSLKPLKYKIIKRGNLKIGIISNPANNSASSKSTELTATALSNLADRLKNLHQCALVLCMSTGNIHSPKTNPLKNDIELASLTTHVDLIISGNNEVKSPINYVCHNAEKEEVLIHSSSFSGSSVGRIDIELCSKMQKRNVKVYYNDGLA